jgi:hypothetical protein
VTKTLFAYLCMHGALHWWNRLKWLADLNALLACTPEHGIERLLQSAEARGGSGAPGAAALSDTSSDAPTRFIDGHAAQERHDALASSDSAEGDDHGSR